MASGGGFPLYPQIYTVLHNDPAAPQDHCGRCRIRTRDLCLRSMARYGTNEPPHLRVGEGVLQIYQRKIPILTTPLSNGYGNWEEHLFHTDHNLDPIISDRIIVH